MGRRGKRSLGPAIGGKWGEEGSWPGSGGKESAGMGGEGMAA